MPRSLYEQESHYPEHSLFIDTHDRELRRRERDSS